MKKRILALAAALLVLSSGCARSNKGPIETEPVMQDSNKTVLDGVEEGASGFKPGDNTKPIKPSKVPDTTEPSTGPKPTKPVHPSEVEPEETTPYVEVPIVTAPVINKPEVTEPTEPEPTEPEPLEPGWLDQDGERYYIDDDGSYHTGWLTLDGDRYYFLSDGTMAKGIVQVPGDCTRYFTSTGKECILVNPWNYVPDDYTVELSKYGDYKVASSCLDDLKQMLADCKSDGKRAIVCSAYRSHSYQEGLYERRVQRFVNEGLSLEEAKIEAAKRVAVPGTSEHELGLAVDIVDINYQNLDEKQEDTAAQKWLMANSWRYGFILRYPNNKSEVTGIIYEPWHYRYVGKELAEEIYNSGLCLEEYFKSLS